MNWSSGLRTDLTEFNQGLELAGKTFGALKGVANFFVDQAKQAGTFEEAMAAVEAVTGATGDEFKALEAAAVAASERTRFSSVQAADGLAELARTGYSATEAMQVLNPALAIAQGQQLSVAQASEYLTTTMTQFGLGAGDAARVADVLAATADSSKTSVQQLGNALSYVAPLANQAGLSIEETSAIIGALADQGFRGERAGTALRNVFSSLSDPSSKFSQALRDAGIESRDFTTVVEQLAAGGDIGTQGRRDDRRVWRQSDRILEANPGGSGKDRGHFPGGGDEGRAILGTNR
ncbi:MAG: phage tail tape measure protein [Rhodanobacteraceae bacterium]|nr:phage tail tape measure protein [Rhodanobacteraceae bacterium]